VDPHNFDRFERLNRAEARRFVPREGQDEYLHPSYSRTGLRVVLAFAFAIIVAAIVIAVEVF
jgi:hypothetical protein